MRERPRVGWVTFIGRVMSVECPNGFVERKKSLGAPEIVWQMTGKTVSSSSGMRWGTGRAASSEVGDRD